jgi:HPt (histidine-containing phosphotransfer) domain-containing protein
METIVVHPDPEIRELIPDFLENRRRDVHTLRDAAGAADFDALYRIGHSLKGVGGGFGFDAISDIGRAIETAAAAHRLDEIEDRIEALRTYLERVQVVFDPVD